MRKGEAGEFAHLVAVALPVVAAAKAWPLVQGQRFALDRVGDFAVDPDLAAVLGEEAQVLLHGHRFLFRRAFTEPARVPAGDDIQAITGHQFAQGGRFLRELVAELEAFVTDGLALGQRGGQRYFAPEGRQVVVAPGNRIDTDADGIVFHAGVILALRPTVAVS